MKIILHKNKLQRLIQGEKRLGFVPTMGAIHKGHLSLIKKSISQCNKTIVSIFINKGQFNKKRDYLLYPRLINRDISIIKKLKVDYLFIPAHKNIYPNGPSKIIKISPFSKKLCGKNRPGHFESVADVIDRFLSIIKPKFIYLGMKDFQQVRIIEDYIVRKKISTKVIECKTIREKNGIACSTRNNNLNKKEINIVSNAIKYLKSKKKLIKKNISNFRLVDIKNNLINLGVTKIEYIELYNLKTLKRPKNKREKFKIFIAFYLNKTRLIDNI